MKILCCFITMMVLTFAHASMLDPLYDYDYARIVEKGLYIAGGPEANMDNGMYDKDGKKVSSPDGYKYSSLDFWVPLRLGYSFNELFNVGFVIPITSLSQNTTPGTGVPELKETNFGLGDPWVWSKTIFLVSNGLLLGPRLGIKIPSVAYTLESQGKDTYENHNNLNYQRKALTGDKSLAIDAAVIFAARPDTNNFRLDSQLAIRYNTEALYVYDKYITTTGATQHLELTRTPGIWADFRLMPGMAFGDIKNIETYLWLEYATKLTEDKTSTKGTDVSGNSQTTKSSIKGGNMASVGIRADYAFDPDNNLEIKFLYDVKATGGAIKDSMMSSPIPAGLSVGIGYFGYIPMM